MGGEPLAEDAPRDARFLTCLQVQWVSQAVSKISCEDFRHHLSPADLTAAEIYPWSSLCSDFWYRPDIFGYFIGQYSRLGEFYARAAARQLAIVQWA